MFDFRRTLHGRISFVLKAVEGDFYVHPDFRSIVPLKCSVVDNEKVKNARPQQSNCK